MKRTMIRDIGKLKSIEELRKIIEKEGIIVKDDFKGVLITEKEIKKKGKIFKKLNPSVE